MREHRKQRAESGKKRAIFFSALCSLLSAILFLLPNASRAARPIIADLAVHDIEIDTKFTGIDILLFGARDEAGDIVVAVKGPKRDYIVRKKEKVAGVWVNGHEEKFAKVPSFYALSSSKPVERIDNGYLLNALGVNGQIGNDDFASALYDLKRQSGLYVSEPGKVTFWGETLFRTNLRFPANIEGGTYLAEIYLFSDGQLVSVQSTPIHVKKVGFEALTYEFAHKHAEIYGALSILLALSGGWLASVIFRKV